MSSPSMSCFDSSLNVALGKNEPVINRPGTSLGKTTLIPPSEPSTLNRLDVRLECGKEDVSLESSLVNSNRQRTVDYNAVLHTGYCCFDF
jgi:hypothetical protein